MLIASADTYPVVCQLKADLYEGIGADAKLLDPSLTEICEGEDVTVHIICQGLSDGQRAALLCLHLRKQPGENAILQGWKIQKGPWPNFLVNLRGNTK